MIEFSILGTVVVIVLIAAFVYSKNSVARTDRAWKSVAEKLNLEFSRGPEKLQGCVKGEYHNHRVKIDALSRSLGPRSRIYTRLKLTYAKPVKIRFEFSKQGVFDQGGRLFGVNDVSVGDSSFDENILVKKGKDVKKSALFEFLNAPRRHGIKSGILGVPEATITNEYIEAVFPNLMEDPIIIVNHLKRLAELADLISKERDKDHPIEIAKMAREQGNIQKAVEILKESEFTELDDKLEAKELEGELLYIADEKDEAAKAFEKLCEEIPEDSESKAWKTIAQSGNDTPLPFSSDELTVKNLTEKVFDSGIGTFDSTDRFEREFQGGSVLWEGTLVSTKDFSFDSVFKNCDGIKATLELMELKSGYSSNKIKAVVHFPKDQITKLEKHMNQKMKFSGELFALDALMKNIFVAEGKIR